MAAEVDFLAVLEFLRRNGLHDCESALMDDVMEKSRLGSSEFDKFFIPMPPLRIQAYRRPPPGESTGGDGGWSSNCSSECEFVSAVSSAAEFCSSDSTTPYGICMSRPSSQASSDELSDFGTAQDCPDSSMQNEDLFWFKDRDEYSAMMLPAFEDQDFDEDPSEDKFMTSILTGEPIEDLSKHQLMAQSKDFCKLNGAFELDKIIRGCNDHTCPAHSRIYASDLIKYTLENFKTTNLSSLSPKKTNQFVTDEVVEPELNKPNPTLNKEHSDEVLLREDKDEDYEVFHLRIIHRKNSTGFEENKELPIVLNSIIAGRYYVTEFLGSAAFSRVVQAHDLCSGMDVCLKIIKNDKDFFDQSLDEIKLLKYVNRHDPADEHHILRLYDYFYHQEHLFIVTELLRANLYELQKYTQESGGEPYFTMPRLQAIAQQCLGALLYLHNLGIIHCDLKPENILVKSYRRCEIKVIDLGSSCFQTDHLSLYVQSRSYRAPEVMLGLPYDQKIDVWSLGCILAELYSGEVLFPNETVVLLLARMIAMLGPIDLDMLQKGEEKDKYFTEEYDLYYINEESNEVEYIIPEESSVEHHLRISDSLFADFLKYLLEMNPDRRPTVREVLAHPWLSHTYGDI